MSKAVFVPDDYRQPAELVTVLIPHKEVLWGWDRGREPGLFIPLHRDDATPRSTRAGRNRGR